MAIEPLFDCAQRRNESHRPKPACQGLE